MLYPQYFIDHLKGRADIVRILVLLILAVCVSHVSFAQDKQEVALIDQFMRENCEMTKARIDNLMSIVNSSAQNYGVIAINAKQNGLRSNLIYEEMLRGSMLLRRFSFDRVRFVRTNDKPEGEVRMWIVQDQRWMPAGENGWDLTIAADTKPFIVSSEWYYAEDVCPPVDGRRVLAELLNANPTAQSHIVVRSGSRLLSLTARQKLLRDFDKESSVSKTRIHFFFAKRTHPRTMIDEPDTEFWFVPAKSK